MRFLLSFFLLIYCFTAFSQEKEAAEIVPTEKIDSLYREDQFYFGVSLNTLQKKSTGIDQSKLSLGFSIGFLRDMPINKKRTLAFASGLGFSYAAFNQNLKIQNVNSVATYSIIGANTSFTKNNFEQLFIDLPLEFRWRNSTYESYKFWRVYGGLKLSYVVYNRSIYSDDQSKIVVVNNSDFNKFQYGLYISSGYNTFNLYGYYGLNSMFKSAKIGDQAINMNAMNIGVIFYIL